MYGNLPTHCLPSMDNLYPSLHIQRKPSSTSIHLPFLQIPSTISHSLIVVTRKKSFFVQFQGPPGDQEKLVAYELMVTILEEPAFDILRTQEQLGYSAFATLRNSFGVLGLSVSVISQVGFFLLLQKMRRNDSILFLRPASSPAATWTPALRPSCAGSWRRSCQRCRMRNTRQD